MQAAGVRYAALTDHDTVEGLPRFRSALAERGIGFISGMEWTASHPWGEVHLLAYGLPFGDSPRADSENEDAGASDPSPSDDPLPSWPGRLRSGLHTAIRGAVGEPKLDSPARVIARIHEAGALAFLAHPLEPCRDLARASRLLAELRRAGLDGVEALYKPYPPDVRSSLVHLASRHGLLIAGGSDFHGNGVHGAGEPGCEISPVDWERLVLALG
jgi:predicted metal-dependent phosphoesterase TrpH